MKLNEIISDEEGEIPENVAKACEEYFTLAANRLLKYDDKMQRYHDKICDFFDALHVDSFAIRLHDTIVAGLYITDDPRLNHSSVYITIKPFTKYIRADFIEDNKDIDEKTVALMKMHGDYYAST